VALLASNATKNKNGEYQIPNSVEQEAETSDDHYADVSPIIVAFYVRHRYQHLLGQHLLLHGIVHRRRWGD
jgi:hypothetical protein